MSDQQSANSGVLFKNNRMRPEKDDPPYQGSALINGVDYWLSAWVNTSKKDGSKFFGIRFKPKEKPTARTVAPPIPDDDSEVPF